MRLRRDGLRWPWALAIMPSALFVLGFLALTAFADPQHDDFCFSFRYVEEGLSASINRFYSGLGGRVIPYVMIELPAIISSRTGLSLLAAYSLTMAVCAVGFVGGCVFAVVRAWPELRGLPSLFLGFGFAAAVLGASTSVRDLLYWLPGVACYVPPAVICILTLSEIFRALDRQSGFSGGVVIWMTLGAFVAGSCNEFTTVWLAALLAGSVFARRLLDQNMQIGSHAIILSPALAAWAIVLSAGGNRVRMAQFDNARRLGHALLEALRFGMVQLGQFLREPSVIAWLAAVFVLTLALPATRSSHHPRARFLAPGIVILCLTCCYVEYFAHYYSTGIRLVERAQNQALLLLLFGSGLAMSLVVRAHRARLAGLLPKRAVLSTTRHIRLPIALAIASALSLSLSRTAFLIYAEGSTLYPYWRETVVRHQLLLSSTEPIVTVQKHRWTPSLFLSGDVMINTECIARYFGKAELVVIDAPAD